MYAWKIKLSPTFTPVGTSHVPCITMDILVIVFQNVKRAKADFA